MNRNTYSLVFDARRGMRVAVSEAVTLAGKSPRGGRCRAPVVAAVLALAASSVWPQSRPQMVFAPNKNAPAFNLPQPYGTTPVRQADGSFKVRTDKSFVADPKKASQITWSVDGKNATLDQGNVDRVILNWDSFDIGAGYSVHFKQDRDPTKYVSALNRIWSLDPSVILGSLTADREVILLNANGVYFGRGARVDTGKFVASALGIADDVFEKGLRNVKDGSVVFSSAGTDYTPTSRDAVVAVDAGAEIRAAAGGDVLLIAPKVLNQGRIETPSGQTVLAAGDKVYLMSSSDSKQRGLIVAVDPIKAADGSNDTTLGIVENAATGSYKTVNGATVADSTPDQTAGLVKRINEIRADSGSVNLVGLTVRQNGQINATTAVKGANGAIYLQAMASTTALVAEPDAANRGLVIEPGSVGRVGATLGTVQFGQDSVTAVRPDAGGATQLDAEVFNPSLIRAEGAAISVERGASIIAPGGKIELLASQNADRNPIFYAGQPGAGVPDDSRVVVAPGATISAAGLQNVKVDGARNQGAQRLFRIELADSPVQRSGPLYRSQVFFDARDASKISVADVTGSSAAVARTASERSTTGGDIRIEADGSVVIGDGASLDVSGGSVNYSQTTLKNTLLSQNGGIVTFRAARAGDQVDAVLSTQQQAIVPAYTEGADGGSLLLNGHDLLLAGALSGQVTQGERQRDGRSARAAPATLTIGAREGSLYYLDTIALRPAGGSVAVDPALLRDPLQGPLPALSGSVDLSLDAVSRGGFGALSLRAGHVLQRELGAIDLGIGGSLDIESRTIDLNGVFAAAGGHISLVTAVASSDQPKEGDIQLSETTRLDVAGRWTNDTALAGGARAADVQLDGGSVRVAAGHSVIARPGATIDASAGAWLAGNGALSTGKAGAIDLSIGTNPNMPASLAIAGMRLRGYDFDVGGSLTLGTPGLTIANAAVAGAEGMTLTPEFFSAGGFGNITVNAFGDVRVASGTRLAPTLANWQLAESYRSAQSGPMGIGVASPQTLDTKL
ncbi:MAG TPA: filamentous hemagglutinin N-terminal domain-containing protein, partial [Burkholderiaceae bacterium]|nr:filamentous hemagglutinin N-terminal domain-containing protein [Burkholderiaceae bacterium]